MHVNNTPEQLKEPDVFQLNAVVLYDCVMMLLQGIIGPAWDLRVQLMEHEGEDQ